MREGEPVVPDADLASEADTPPLKFRRASWSADADAASDAASPYRYTARRVDSESGLMQYRNRYYLATVGRFVSRDPEGYADWLNLYCYVRGQAIGFSDPFGLSARSLVSDLERRNPKVEIKCNDYDFDFALPGDATIETDEAPGRWAYDIDCWWTRKCELFCDDELVYWWAESKVINVGWPGAEIYSPPPFNKDTKYGDLVTVYVWWAHYDGNSNGPTTAQTLCQEHRPEINPGEIIQHPGHLPDEDEEDGDEGGE